MADSYIRVPPDSTGKKVDAASLDVGAESVIRQRIVLADNSASGEFAQVAGGALIVAGTFNLSGTAQVAIATPFTVNNISATVTVAGTVNLGATANAVLGAGSANIGSLNHISRTAQVAIATPFTVNNISATVAVAGVVGLTAGTAVIGALDYISRTAQVAIATPFTVNNISATVIVAGVVNLSATASVVLGAGSANIGSINNISATVNTVVAGFTPAVMSTSHGPNCIQVSTSAAVSLIASPGAGASLYITQIMAGNAGLAMTKLRIGTSASASAIVQPIAANGGGFVFKFDPPWMLSASERAICSVKPNLSDVYVTVNYFTR